MSLRAAFESLPPTGGEHTALTLLPQNPDAWAARWRLLASAHESLDISYFIRYSARRIEALGLSWRKDLEKLPPNSPISSDNALSQAFFMEQWPELLANVPGLRIFVSGKPHTVHSKLTVFDDQVALVGTYNLDPISMAINSEIMAAVWSRRFAEDVGAHAYQQVKHGTPYVYEYTIQRDAKGRAVRGQDGRPIVTFGPKDHAQPDEWRKVQLYWTMLRAAEKVPGFSPLF
ncbi:MAG: phospholipase D family protein [Gammaproteobacteria bacterium]|nr:phospholipase D family protein [Gammaproteobacteria bacterium]